MSSVVGSLAWDADDLDGELCLGAGVGAATTPCKERKHRKCPDATVRILQKTQGSSYVEAQSLDPSSHHGRSQLSSLVPPLDLLILSSHILGGQEAGGPHR